ncbi:MAG: translation initiation factor IF-2 [Candidatus Schekmanbacteria bacterium]|nr:translation initiation factor IF-2 [Candidatus Schekmanbacteria bacterium]
MSRVRVYEVAKRLGLSSKDVVERLAAAGVDVKSHLSYVERSAAEQVFAEKPRTPDKVTTRPPRSEPAEVAEERPEVAPPPNVRARKRQAAPEPVVAPPVTPPPAPVVARPRPASSSAPAAPRVVERSRPETAAAPRKPSGESQVTRGYRGSSRGEEEAGREFFPRNRPSKRFRKRRPAPTETEQRHVPTPPADGKVQLAGPMLVREAAELFGISAPELCKRLIMRGIMATVNQSVASEALKAVAEELGLTVSATERVTAATVSKITSSAREGAPRVERAPVVTVMGHVDHGKTSLLDRIRKTSVAAGEAGGITQHIGAYSVDTHSGKIVFLDTPGHEAFTAMRARGASITDLVILVVAATDGVMPQTVEAIDHAKAAAVPIVVALNKIDLPGADINRIYQDLAQHDLVPEAWGGKTVVVPCSAKNGTGIDELLEMVLLEAELLELSADPEGVGRGVVVESRIDRGRGPVGTVLMQRGTLHIGSPFVVGTVSGRVRAMFDDQGREVTEAGPAAPVEVIGFADVPQAGEVLEVITADQDGRKLVEDRRAKAELAAASVPGGQQGLQFQVGDDEVKQLTIILKTDVQGSLEAVSDALLRIGTEKINIKILHGAVGPVSDSDVLLASATGAIVIGFGIRPIPSAATLAAKENVEIKLYSIIYELIEELKNALSGLLSPTFEEESLGRAEVRQTFRVPRIGVIAGCIVLSGLVRRASTARLVRDGRVVHTGKIASLRRFKNDAREVLAGYECGIGFEGFQDLKVGDIIEAFAMKEVAPTKL